MSPPGPLPVHGRIPSDGAQPEDRSPLCRAPFVAMEFDAFGDVQACCANVIHPLGNVARSSLRAIWDGPRATRLREALTAGDLSFGCSICRHRLTYGHGDLARDYYDNFPLDADATWPFSLQFSLHNTCNLACVMCGADRSSRIRTQRSHLPALPHVYGEAFFAEIEPFLAHAGAVDFSGGEPFLVREHDRLWDLLIGLEHRPLHSLTTNGTIWNDRVEHVLDALDTHVTVSLDGMTAATFERIRVGARFDQVLANLERFRAYTRERGTILTIGWSLLQQNWHELGAAARFADAHDIDLKVHTVIEPDFGIQQLPTDELAQVVVALEAESEALAGELHRNRAMWEREVARLRRELEVRAASPRRARCMEPPTTDTIEHVVATALGGGTRRLDGPELEAALVTGRADLAGWCPGSRIVHLDLDPSGIVLGGSLDGVLPGGARVAAPAGCTLAEVLRGIEVALGGALWIGDEFDEGDRVVQTLWVGRRDRDKVGLVVRTVAVASEMGVTYLVAADATLLPGGTGEVPVQLGRPVRELALDA